MSSYTSLKGLGMSFSSPEPSRNRKESSYPEEPNDTLIVISLVQNRISSFSYSLSSQDTAVQNNAADEIEQSAEFSQERPIEKCLKDVDIDSKCKFNENSKPQLSQCLEKKSNL